eukprot:gene16678-25595_t
MRRVVVTGIGCVTPLGLTAKETWAALIAGKCGLRAVEDVHGFWHTWPAEAVGLTCRVAGPVKDDGAYNPNSRQSRATLMAVASAREALLQSGLADELAGKEASPARERLRDATGVAFGTGMSSLSDIFDVGQALMNGKPKAVTPFFVPKILCNAAAGAISIAYGARGPNHSASTACATGAHSIGDASRLIRYGDADVMVCGGTESCLNPIAFIGFQRAKAMTTQYNNTPQQASRPFDAERSGFVMSEGAAALVLEEYQHAKARGAVILAEVVGYGMSGDAYHVTSPDPQSTGMKLCMERSINEAVRVMSLDKRDVVDSIAYANAIGEVLRRDSPVPVSSTKGNMGHLLGAAGAIEAAVAIWALQQQKLPGTLNLQQ